MSFSAWFWGDTIQPKGTYRSTAPVSLEEGRELFETAYRNRSKYSRHMDKIKRQETTLIPGSAESYKYRNRYVGNKIVASGPVEYDLEGVDSGIGKKKRSRKSTESAEMLKMLKTKVDRLYEAYENKYEEFLQATKFWEELQKIRFSDTEQTYHDLFITRIVGCEAPICGENRLLKYKDLINTSFYLAVKYRLCEDLPEKSGEVLTSKEQQERLKKKIEQYKSEIKPEECTGLLGALF